MDEICEALQNLRAPLEKDEYDLHRRVIEALAAAGLSCRHEVKLGPRCRIDLMCGTVGIELKRGHPPRARLLEQLRRYAGCEGVTGLIVVCERHADIPRTIGGKPVRLIGLNRLWGIAL